MLKVSRHAPAKVNLFLQVGPRVGSGRHLINSVVVPLRLGDTVEVSRSASLACTVGLEPELARMFPENGRAIVEELSSANNLASRAAGKFFANLRSKECVAIRIVKRVPLQAGLGGGSGDAAATLLALNELFGMPLSVDELLEIAGAVGSDVPALLLGSPAVLMGTGEEVIPCRVGDELSDCDLLLVKPEAGVSTGEAYAALNRSAATDEAGSRGVFSTNGVWLSALHALRVTLEIRSTNAAESALTLQRELANSARSTRVGFDSLQRGVTNDFEKAVERAAWFIEGSEQLRSAGAEIVVLCGSGSCICGFVPSEKGATAELRLRDSLHSWWIARTQIGGSPSW